MSDLTAKFTTLEEQLAAQNATIASYIDTIEAKLQAMLDLQDIVIVNNAANTKALLGALSNSAACFPCPLPSITVPPTGTTPYPVNADACKRAQAFLATMQAIFAAMDTLQSFNVVGTFNVLNDTISQVIAGVAAGDTVPLPSFPETVNIVGDYISYAGERAFSGVGLVEQFVPLVSALQNVLYAAGTPGAAQSAYNGVIEGSGVSNGARLLFEASAYNALYTYFFDPASEPDLSPYSGDACSIPIGTCVSLTTVPATFSNGTTPWVINLPFGAFSPVNAIAAGGGTVTSSEDCFFDGNADGWSAYSNIGHVDFAHRLSNLATDGFIDSGGIPAGEENAIPLPATGCFFIQGDREVVVTLCYTG